jgi:hypothetical protein
MKKFMSLLLMIVVLVAFAIPALAKDVFSQKLFNSYTGSAGVARNSTIFNYGVFTKKTVTIGGMHSAAVYAPYSGVVTLVGASAAAGPWVPLKDKAGNVVTATGNATFDLDSMVPFVKAVWTRTKHRVTVWIHYGE